MTNTPGGPVRTPRGRPYSRNPGKSGISGVTPRVAWLLRVNRILGPQDDFGTISSFVDVFQGGSHPGRISGSTISRCETGLVKASYQVIRRYEELLGHRAGELVSVADVLHRYWSPRPTAAPVLTRSDDVRPPVDGRLDELLERALSPEPMAGSHWDTLTADLLAHPRFFLPSRMWGELARRLVDETAVADGSAWMQRFEAISRLLGHPAADRFMLEACSGLVTEPGNQVFVEPVSILDSTDHPDASRFVLAQLADPINSRARYGALLACVRKTRFGHFTEDQMVRLVALTQDILTEPEPSSGELALAVELLRRLGPSARASVAVQFRRALAADRSLQEVAAVGRLATSWAAQAVVDRLASAARRGVAAAERTHHRVAAAAVFVDDVLPEVVDEMLFAPVIDDRLNAALLLRSTPYAEPLAAALAAELSRPGTMADPTLSDSLLGALRTIGRASQRAQIERLVLAAGGAAAIRQAAVDAVAHLGGVSADGFYLAAIEQQLRWWQRDREPAAMSLLVSLVYALGIARNQPLLSRCRDDPEVPGPVRAAAGWWLARPVRLFVEPADA